MLGGFGQVTVTKVLLTNLDYPCEQCLSLSNGRLSPCWECRGRRFQDALTEFWCDSLGFPLRISAAVGIIGENGLFVLQDNILAIDNERNDVRFHLDVWGKIKQN